MSRLKKESSFRSGASASQEGLEEGPSISFKQPLRVTLLSSEWRSLKGGLSTIGRELAIQFAKHPNVEVCVYLPKCSEEDKNVAASQSVKLIEAEELPGVDSVLWLSSVPQNHAMDCIIGHGVPLGQQIPQIRRRHDCKWIQVVHTAPEELEMFKSYEEAISKGEQKHQAEVKLCELADQVVAVGPKLADAYSRYLRFSRKVQDVINLTPSIFREFLSVQQATEERSTFCVLVFGRGDSEDFKLKGYDIAVRAVAKLEDSSYRLMFVGAPTGKEDDVAAKLLEHGIHASQLTVRTFKESREELAKLFCEVDLAIMPSRTEGFGLTALEALSAGLPVLVSGNSGLGDALKEVPSGRYHVVDSEDPKEWAKSIKIVRQKGRDVRLEEANLLREKYALKYSWQAQCDNLVDKMLMLSSSSTDQPSAVDSSLLHSLRACAASAQPVCTTIHLEEQGGIKQDFCQDIREHPSKRGKRWLSSAVSQPMDYDEGSSSTDQPSAVDSSLLHSHGACAASAQPVCTTFHLEEQGGFKQDFCQGSGDIREHPSKKGKRWLPSAVSQPRDRGKGKFDHRHFRKLLEDEYINRSKLKPLLWENTIQLPLDEVYTRLELKWRRTATFELTGEEIHLYEIFNLKKPEEKSGWYRRLHSMFRKNSQEKARMVLVEGSPGIGKTTFCLKIANDWARKAIPKKHGFPVFKLMLLLKCRDMDGDVMQAIDDQLLPEDITEKKKQELLNYIRDEENQEKILIILDGLDELPKVAEEFVEKLLSRKVLSRCSVLATSRQEKGIEIRQRHVLDTLLQINGFTMEDASEYIRKHFRTVGQSQADLLNGEKLIQAIKENIFLHALRNNPLNLLLLCVVFGDHKGELPSNRTKLYQIIHRCLLRRFCSKNDMEVDKDDIALDKRFESSMFILGELAWRCLLEERPSFLQEELNELEVGNNGKGVSAAKVGLVFMEASVRKLNPKHEYHFLHRTFQEFLAAAYLILLMKRNVGIFDKFQFNNIDITSKYQQVFLFAAGILGKDATIFFKHIGQILYRSWNWQFPEENCRFLIELLSESEAPNDLVATVCQCIPLPQCLELSLEDRHTLKLVQYTYETSSLSCNVEPRWIEKLSLTKAHALSEDSARDIDRILENNKTLKDLLISANYMTNQLADTLLRGLSSNLSLLSLTLEISRSIPADVADKLGTRLSFCNSLTTVNLKLFSDSNAWAGDVSTTGLLKSTYLESVNLEYYGVPGSTAVHAFKLLTCKRSLISFSLTLFGDMEDCLASALSEGLSEETSLNSFSVVIHGNVSNHGAALLAKGFLLKRTLRSLVFKVLGDVPEHWTGVVDTIHALAANKSCKSITLHPNVQGEFVDASFSPLHPISRVCLSVEKTLTLHLWGELTIRNVKLLGDHLLRTSLPLSSLTLNINGKVSNGVADCLVKFFVANNVLRSLTINLRGEISSFGQTTLQTLDKSQLKSFSLNVDGLVRDDSVCESAQKNCSTSTALSIDISSATSKEVSEILGRQLITELSVVFKTHCHRNYNDGSGVWGNSLGAGLSNNNSLTSFTLTVHNYNDASGNWGFGLGEGLSNNKSLTSFTLTVHNYVDASGNWGLGLGEGLSNNKSLTSFTLTVHNYIDASVRWGLGLGEGLSDNKSLTSFTLTVHNYIDVSVRWGFGLGKGLLDNKSLTSFTLTVHNYNDASGDWGFGLGKGLSDNKSLMSFTLTVHNYVDASGDWGFGLGEGLSDNKSLTSFTLTVHNYIDVSVRWGLGLGEGLLENKSLTSFTLTVHNYNDASGDWGFGLGKGLSDNKSLMSFTLTVHNYVDASGDWGFGLGKGLSDNKSLTSFTLTVHNYVDASGGWGTRLGKGLSDNKSLTSFTRTVHNYVDASGDWEIGLGEGLSNNKSLTSFTLTVHIYADSSESLVHNLAKSLAKSCSLTSLKLVINDHTGVNRDLDDTLFKSLEKIKSLTSLTVSVSFYGEDNVKLN